MRLRDLFCSADREVFGWGFSGTGSVGSVVVVEVLEGVDQLRDFVDFQRQIGAGVEFMSRTTCYATCGQFADTTLGVVREKVPRNWADFRVSLTDNFRVISPKDFQVVT